MNLTKSTNGFSLIELVIAIGIFSVLSASVVALLLGGLDIGARNTNNIKANALATQALEAARSISIYSWDSLDIYSTGITEADGRWVFGGEGTSDNIGQFSRELRLNDIYRDSNGLLVEESDAGAILDQNSKEIEVEVSWPRNNNDDLSVIRRVLLTNW